MITRKMLKSGVNFLVKLTKRERERKRENKKLIEFSDAVASPALLGAASKWKKHQNWSSIHAESEWGIVDRELCSTAGLQDCRTAGAPVHFTGLSGRYWQPMLWLAGPRRLPHWQPLRLSVVSHGDGLGKCDIPLVLVVKCLKIIFVYCHISRREGKIMNFGRRSNIKLIDSN